jgi:hypothetical protein
MTTTSQKNSLRIIVTCFLLITFSSCKKFLEVNPDNRIRPQSVEDYQAILTGALPQAFHLFTELYTDNYRYYDYPDFNNANIQSWLKPIYLWSDEYISNSGITPEGGWRKYYNSIYVANVVLEGLNKATGDEAHKSSLRGEALLVRAYCHFMLVNIFAKHYNETTAATDLGIPYALATEKQANTPYKRDAVKVVYDLAEKDALEGLSLINDALYDKPKFHFSTTSANALLSRLYLFKGDYEKSLLYSEKVFAKTTAVRDLFKDYDTYMATGLYAEFAGRYCTVEQSNILLMNHTLEWNSFARTGMYANEYRNTFASADLRGKLYTFTSNQTPNYIVRKFRSQTPSDGQQYSNVSLFVVEEVMYNAAEAAIRKANPNPAYAIDKLNAILIKRLRPYTTLKAADFATNDALLAKIIDERNRELCYEGYRWFDIKRFNIPLSHWTENGTINLPANDPRRVFQIPVPELTANPLMEPNPR